MTLPAELEALRDEAMRTSCEAWAIQKNWTLSRGIDRAGPCPQCGGTDRFSIHTRNNVFNCRQCGIHGSGVIDLVMATEGVSFVRACEIITGRSASEPMDAERAAAHRREREAEERKRAADAAAYRERARQDGHKIWREGIGLVDPQSEPVWQYLERRALPLLAGMDIKVLRCHRDLPFMEEITTETGARGWQCLHSGPAMLAAVQMPDDRFGAVHQTWIDLAQPKGKLVLPLMESGKPRPSKKVRGTKKGGAIRLFSPPHPHRLVMGEGIETTLTALCHAREPDTAYWAGVDLGNMAGKALYRDGHQVHAEPDMDDRDCFLPPAWCEELVYLGEGDAPEVHSREKCFRGLKRARRLRELARLDDPSLPPLAIRYVAAEGEDLNAIAMAELQAGGERDADPA